MNRDQSDSGSNSRVDTVSDIDQKNRFNNFDNESSIGGGESQYGMVQNNKKNKNAADNTSVDYKFNT